MANKNNHINYTATDFERYHNGLMPEADMYALEKAALEDPFLADALDGYVYAKTPVEDIKELIAQISPKEENKKAPVVSFNTLWLRVAAVFVLIAGIGYITYRSNNNTKESLSPTLAQQENKAVVAPANAPVSVTQKPDNSLAAPVEKNNVRSDVTLHPAQQSSGNTQNGTVRAESVYSYYDKDASDDKSVPAKQEEFLALKERQKTDLVRKMYKAPAKQYNLQGKVTDQNGEPVPFASISLAKDSRIGTQSDANGNFLLQSKDSLMLANISAVGYAAVNQNLGFANNQSVILKKQDNTLSEVVVTGYGTQKKASMTGAVATVKSQEILNGKVAGLNIQPVEGMAKYDLYIDSSLRQITAPAQPLRGEVILSFKVNRQGEPIRINVEQSLSKEYNEAAIRLLKQGPKWQFSHGKRASKSFQF